MNKLNCSPPDKNVYLSNSNANHTGKLSLPKPTVICGPSGTGKSTLLKRLMSEFPNSFGFSVSHTTRIPRKGEIDGKDYHFVDKQTMEKAIKNGEFIEFTQFSGNYYGTSKASIKRVQDSNRICILDVEIDGVKNLKKTDINARYVFVKPPHLEVLETRLKNRGTESEESIRRRLERAKDELEFGEVKGNFDTVIVNDEIEEAYLALKSFLMDDMKQLDKSNSINSK